MPGPGSEEIDCTAAIEESPGVVAIYTWQDVPPEPVHHRRTDLLLSPAPIDRLILDRQIRCAGDPVAIVAAETPEAARKALDRIKVHYQVQEPLLDFTKAKDNPIVVHPEENLRSPLRWWGPTPAATSAALSERRGRCGSGAGCQ